MHRAPISRSTLALALCLTAACVHLAGCSKTNRTFVTNPPGTTTTAGGGTTTGGTTGGGTTGGGTTTPLAVATSSLPDATVGIAYFATLSASGGTPPYTWSLILNSLPAGLGLDPVSGSISGTPPVPANASFTVRVTDAATATADATLSLTTIAATPNPGTGTGTWTDLNTVQLPTPLATHAAAAVGNSIFLIGGLGAQSGSSSPQPSSAIIEYLPDAGTISLRNARLPQARAYLEAVTVGSRIFILGGSDNATIYNSCFVYDPASDVISPIAAMPDARDALAAAAVGTDIYVFGGSKFDFLNFQVAPSQTIFKYDTVTNVWTTVSTRMPQPIQWAKALAFNGKIYVMGGGDFVVDMLMMTQTTLANYDAVFEFDPATNSLTQKASLPVATKMLVGDVIGSKLYVCAGDRTSGVHNNAAPWCEMVRDTYAYDPSADRWETLASFETNVPGQGIFGGRALTAAAAVNGQLLLMGGHTLPSPGMTTPPCPTSQGSVDAIARFSP